MNLSAISERTVIGRALRLPLRLIPSDTEVPILQGPLLGKRWITGSSIHGCWLGSYEYAKQKAFSAAIKPGYSVYDLGANVGFYSLLASVLVGPEGSVFSFEPAPRNLKFLRRHLELNAVTNCSVWDTAVGRSEGISSFDAGPNPAMGRLASESHGTFTVRVVTLDNRVASGQLPRPNVIKCDIEGGEFDALMAAADVLVKHGPTIFLATHGRDLHRQCCRFLTDLHYHLTPIDELPLDQTSEVMATRQEV
jgi:FkbM family methyltransferase